MFPPIKKDAISTEERGEVGKTFGELLLIPPSLSLGAGPTRRPSSNKRASSSLLFMPFALITPASSAMAKDCHYSTTEEKREMGSEEKSPAAAVPCPVA